MRLQKATIIELLCWFWQILPEVFFLWLQCWVVVEAWFRDTIVTIVENLAATVAVIVNPIDVVVHPVERHCRNLCVMALFLPIKDLSSQRLCRTIPDAGAD